MPNRTPRTRSVTKRYGISKIKVPKRTGFRFRTLRLTVWNLRRFGPVAEHPLRPFGSLAEQLIQLSDEAEKTNRVALLGSFRGQDHPAWGGFFGHKESLYGVGLEAGALTRVF